MNIENLNVSLAEAPDKPVEIILRAGVEPTPIALKDRETIAISGDIDTPLKIIEDKPHWKTKDSVSIISDSITCDPVIIVEFDPSNPYGQKVKGTLQTSRQIEALKINEGSSFNNKLFIELIINHAHIFNSEKEAKALINALRNFKAKIETDLVDKDDRKGNTDLSIIKRLKREESGIPDSINVKLPFFENQEAQEIELEIEIDVLDKHVFFGFYSLGYQKKKKDMLEAIINSKIKAIEEKGIPVIRN